MQNVKSCKLSSVVCDSVRKSRARNVSTGKSKTRKILPLPIVSLKKKKRYLITAHRIINTQMSQAILSLDS